MATFCSVFNFPGVKSKRKGRIGHEVWLNRSVQLLIRLTTRRMHSVMFDYAVAADAEKFSLSAWECWYPIKDD